MKKPFTSVLERTGRKERGTVWYLLGIVKTLHMLKQSQFASLPDIQIMETEFKCAATFLAQYQSTCGLWYSFLDRPATEIDTMASVGLAVSPINIG